jgi:hypothetical protein
MLPERNRQSSGSSWCHVNETARLIVTETRDETILFFPGEIGERALRARLVAGEDAAYRDCYQRYAPKLMRLLMGILHNKARAEEILQDTFIAAFRSVGQIPRRSQHFELARAHCDKPGVQRDPRRVPAEANRAATR